MIKIFYYLEVHDKRNEWRCLIFLPAGHPLTVPKGVILCKKNDAIKSLGLYRFHVQALRFMMVKIDFTNDHTLNFFLDWNDKQCTYLSFFRIFHVFSTCCENNFKFKLLKSLKNWIFCNLQWDLDKVFCNLDSWLFYRFSWPL